MIHFEKVISYCIINITMYEWHGDFSESKFVPLGAKCERAKYAQYSQCFSLAQTKSGFWFPDVWLCFLLSFCFSYVSVGFRNIK